MRRPRGGGVYRLPCGVYNTTAWFYRRDPHLKINAIVYTLAVAYELKQTLHHLNAPQRCLPQAVVEVQAA